LIYFTCVEVLDVSVDSLPRKLTPPQVAKAWGIDVLKVLHWIKTGQLRAINGARTAGGRPRYLIDVEDLKAFEHARSAIPLPTPTRTRRAGNGKGAYAYF
jgi:hypothetical protein